MIIKGKHIISKKITLKVFQKCYLAKEVLNEDFNLNIILQTHVLESKRLKLGARWSFFATSNKKLSWVGIPGAN